MISFFLIFIILSSVIVILSKDIKTAILSYGIASLMGSVVFFILKAPDVAIAEAGIGAALTVAIFFFSLKRGAEEDDNS